MEYTALEISKETRLLVNRSYDVTKRFPKDELYGLINQTRRCSIFIPSNIAESCGRRSPKDSIHFFHIYRRSLYELGTQLYLALDQNYNQSEEHQELLDQIIGFKKLFNGFMNYYKTLEIQKTINNQLSTINLT
ncbi:four helix bundle protein [Aquimarina sp. M1]